MSHRFSYMWNQLFYQHCNVSVICLGNNNRKYMKKTQIPFMPSLKTVRADLEHTHLSEYLSAPPLQWLQMKCFRNCSQGWHQMHKDIVFLLPEDTIQLETWQPELVEKTASTIFLFFKKPPLHSWALKSGMFPCTPPHF